MSASPKADGSSTALATPNTNACAPMQSRPHVARQANGHDPEWVGGRGKWQEKRDGEGTAASCVGRRASADVAGERRDSVRLAVRRERKHAFGRTRLSAAAGPALRALLNIPKPRRCLQGRAGCAQTHWLHPTQMVNGEPGGVTRHPVSTTVWSALRRMPARAPHPRGVVYFMR